MSAAISPQMRHSPNKSVMLPQKTTPLRGGFFFEAG